MYLYVYVDMHTYQVYYHLLSIECNLLIKVFLHYTFLEKVHKHV